METNIILQDRKTELAEFSIIQNKIHELRGLKVILDFDLAEMYGIETRVLKQSVRRNIERFEGEDFMFQLTENEIENCSRSQFVTLNEEIENSLKTQFVTLKKGRGHNIKYAPFAFTELGIAMLSSVLNSKTAIAINRNIMRVFVVIRQYALNYVELSKRLEDFMRETNLKFDNNNTQFETIFKIFDELMEQKQQLEKPRTPIGFKRSEEKF